MFVCIRCGLFQRCRGSWRGDFLVRTQDMCSFLMQNIAQNGGVVPRNRHHFERLNSTTTLLIRQLVTCVFRMLVEYVTRIFLVCVISLFLSFTAQLLKKTAKLYWYIITVNILHVELNRITFVFVSALAILEKNHHEKIGSCI